MRSSTASWAAVAVCAAAAWTAANAEESMIQEAPDQRLFMANAWADWVDDLDRMDAFIDAWTSRGLNGCGLQIPWAAIEPSRGDYDWTWLDDRVDRIAEAGLRVHLRLSAHSHRPDWVDAELMRSPDGEIAAAGRWSMLSTADPRTAEAVAPTLKAIMNHVRDRYTDRDVNPVACVLVQLSGPAETEFCHDRWTDFSEPAEAGFRSWVGDRFGEIEALNAAWGTRYAGFDQVGLRNAHPYDFQIYRSSVLAGFIATCADAVHEVPGAAFCVQFGSIWDGISVLRGTRDARAVIEPADWVVVDDYPLYDHAMSMDYLRGHARDKVWGNEIDGPGIVPDERGLEQCMTSLARGARVLWAANWQAEPLANREQWSFWEKVMAEIEANPTPEVVPRQAIVVSLATIHRQQPGAGVDTLFGDLWRRLSNGGRDPVDVVTDTVLIRHPEWAAGYVDGIFVPAGQTWMTDELVAALAGCTVPVYAEDAMAGRLDEYGRPRPAEETPFLPMPDVENESDR